MKEKKLDSLAIKCIKDKLCLNILNNIYEIGEYFEKDMYANIGYEINKIKDKLPSYFYNIKNVVSQKFDKRTPFIDDIKKDIKKIEEEALTFLATLKFTDLLTSIISDYYQTKNALLNEDFVNNDSSLNEDTLKQIYSLLEKEAQNNSLVENGGLFLSMINCSITKDNYNEYIKKSFDILFLDNTKDMISSKIDTLKFKFAPFKYIKESEDKKTLFNIFEKNYENLEKDELLDILKTLDNIAEEYSNKIGDIKAIYGCFMDILAIYNFAPDLDYIFKDDFILKDMFYYTCEMIENKDFSTYENITKNIEKKFEQILNNIEKDEKTIKTNVSKNVYDTYSEAIQVLIALDTYSPLNFEKNILLSSKDSNDLADKSFIEDKTNDFLSFINNLDISNIKLKKLKQQFFFYIPCPLHLEALKIYFKNTFKGLKKETSLLVSYKFLSLANPNFIDELADLENHHCCDDHCNHNH